MAEQKYNIIAIDDDQNFLDMYSRVFSESNVKTFKSVEEFNEAEKDGSLLKGLDKDLGSIVITEILFGSERSKDKNWDRKGLDFAKNIRNGKYNSVGKEIPLLYITSRQNEMIQKEICEIGGIGNFQHKPVFTEYIPELVEELMKYSKKNWEEYREKLKELKETEELLKNQQLKFSNKN